MPRGAEYVLFSPSFPLGDTVRSDLLLIVDASVPVKYDKRSRRQEARSSSAQLVVFVAGLVRVFVRRFTRNGFPLRRTTNVSEVQNACTAHNIVAFAERGRFFFFRSAIELKLFKRIACADYPKPSRRRQIYDFEFRRAETAFVRHSVRYDMCGS